MESAGSWGLWGPPGQELAGFQSMAEWQVAYHEGRGQVTLSFTHLTTLALTR